MMNGNRHDLIGSFVLFVASVFLLLPTLKAQSARLHDAPESADQMKNPYSGLVRAAEIGVQVYAVNCASCHSPQRPRDEVSARPQSAMGIHREYEFRRPLSLSEGCN
jgi:mono/diheme cytochrome c family protein